MPEPSLKAAIEDADGLTGWDFFEHKAETCRGASLGSVDKERADRVCATLARFAASPEGTDVLEALLDVTLRRTSFVAQLGLPMEQAYGYGVFREGQNSLMAMILKMIALGRKGKAEKRRDT